MTSQQDTDRPTPSDFDGLTSIGLSKTQARTYGLIASGQGMTINEMAKRLSVNRTTLYRSIKDLHHKGFVTEWRLTSPNFYRAVPLPFALVNYADYQHKQVKDLIVLQQQLRT
jgi:sugar-specific transcriptional regulator TrmB